MSSDNDSGIATKRQAIEVLIALAREEISELELPAKIVERNPSQAPAAVRKRADKRKKLLEAIKILRGGE